MVVHVNAEEFLEVFSRVSGNLVHTVKRGVCVSSSGCKTADQEWSLAACRHGVSLLWPPPWQQQGWCTGPSSEAASTPQGGPRLWPCDINGVQEKIGSFATSQMELEDTLQHGLLGSESQTLRALICRWSLDSHTQEQPAGCWLQEAWKQGTLVPCLHRPGDKQ